VTKALDIIRDFRLELSLELNICKTEIFWSSCDSNKHSGGLFTLDIGRPTLGLKLLRWDIS
jgi:hypothetical protein